MSTESVASLPLLKGTLDLLVLKALGWGPMHGFGIASWLEASSGGTIGAEDSALYQALHRLESKRWIESEWGLSENNRRAKFYRLTDEGRKQLQVELSTWQRYATAVSKVLETA